MATIDYRDFGMATAPAPIKNTSTTAEDYGPCPLLPAWNNWLWQQQFTSAAMSNAFFLATSEPAPVKAREKRKRKRDAEAGKSFKKLAWAALVRGMASARAR